MPVNELVNASLYVIALIAYWHKHKKIDTYFILMFAFAFTAIISLLYEASGKSDFHTTLFPYFYMFFCFWLCFKPFQKVDVGANLSINETITIKTLMWIYIISGLFAIYYTLPNSISIMILGEYGNLRTSVYAGDDIALYGSEFERLCKNIHSYLSPFGVVMTFYQLIKPKKKWFIIILLFFVWIANTFLGATLVASRGAIVSLILQFLLIYIIFRPILPKSVKRFLYVLAGTLSILFFTYLMAVTVSRFGEQDANNSIFFYLGHAMQVFNEHVFGSMERFAWGRYSFSYFLGLHGSSFSVSDIANLGFTGGVNFYTFLGSFYIDYGLIGTLVLCVFLNLLLTSFTKKQSLAFSDLVVIVYFATFFIKGVFVIGLGYALGWIMLYVVYLIIKFAEKQK